MQTSQQPENYTPEYLKEGFVMSSVTLVYHIHNIEMQIDPIYGTQTQNTSSLLREYSCKLIKEPQNSLG